MAHGTGHPRGRCAGDLPPYAAAARGRVAEDRRGGDQPVQLARGGGEVTVDVRRGGK
ncbi:MAG: hypothetical protein MZV64_30180 [Ignavibacteriales bacterium]|nr:hypothetical protein [Ignavibacteriales bacterium]